MDVVLKGLLITGVAFWACVALAAFWARHRLRRQLRIAPSVRTAAPTAWVISPATAARLHRRLRRAAATARAAAALDPVLAPVADDLVHDAVALEPALLAIARTGRAGTVVRRDLATRVAELEAVARRLTRMAAPTGEPGSAARMRERLVALESAREELADIDLRAGLLRHS